MPGIGLVVPLVLTSSRKLKAFFLFSGVARIRQSLIAAAFSSWKKTMLKPWTLLRLVTALVSSALSELNVWIMEPDASQTNATVRALPPTPMNRLFGPMPPPPGVPNGASAPPPVPAPEPDQRVGRRLAGAAALKAGDGVFAGLGRPPFGGGVFREFVLRRGAGRV